MFFSIAVIFAIVVLCAIGVLFIVIFYVLWCHCRARGNGIIIISAASVKTGIVVCGAGVVIQL